ncbi:MAG: 50S ribosomal protein L18 [bacterium]|nr:50S ribosomal protein L18 [bacterium]
MKQQKEQLRVRRHRRIRSKIKGTADRLRLCVFRSNQHIYAQLIDDATGHVKAHASDRLLKGKENEKGMPAAREVGKLVASLAKGMGAEAVVFDRGGYKYHGRVKALAEGAREEGLKF